MILTAPHQLGEALKVAATLDQITRIVSPETPNTPYYEDSRGPLSDVPETITLRDLEPLLIDETLFEYAAIYEEGPKIPLISPTLTSLAPGKLDRSNKGFLENSLVISEVAGVFDELKRLQGGEKVGREITLMIEELKPKALELLKESNAFSYFEDVNQLQRFVEFSGGFPFEYRPGMFHTISVQRLMDAVRENDFHFLSPQQQESLANLIARSNERFSPIESIKMEH